MSTSTPATLQRIQAQRTREAAALEAAFDHLDPRVAENLSQVMQMWKEEDSGWFQLGAQPEGGLTLTELRQWSKQLREALVGNPHIKRGAELRSDYINEGGIRYGGVQKRIEKVIEDPLMQRRFFGSTARTERYRACYTDGGVFYIGTDSKGSKEVSAAVPLHEIVAEYCNAENSSEVWAYLHEWSVHDSSTGTPSTKREWIYTDIFASKRSGAKNPSIKYNGKSVPVAKDKVIFDAFVNTQSGWRYGAPHALSALVWARLYRDFLVNGKIMSDALAQFAFNLTTKSKEGTKNASLKFASARGSGQTVVGPNEMTPLASAGKGYDFDSGRAIASVVATAIGVSVIHLTSDPGTAGSSYGSAQTLDLPTRLSVAAERQWNAELDMRVLRWLGVAKPRAEFNPLISSTDVYREIQALKLAWDMGLFDGSPIQERIADILGIVEPGAIPAGVLQPNNEETVLINKPAPSAEPDDDDDDAGGGGSQAGGAGQGQGTGAGKGPKGKDTRGDSNADKAASK